MLDFNLEYYRVFYYVSKLHSFTKAAEALFISQPAVSQSIQKLEQHLGCSLLIRKQRGLELTKEGAALFHHVSAAFDQLLIGEQELLRSMRHERGSIRISATETPLHMVVFPTMDLFRAKYPKTSIFLTGGGSTQGSANELRSGSADIAMGVSPLFPTEGFVVYEGGDVESVAVAHPDYPLPSAQPLTAQQLSGETLIFADKGTSARTQLDLWFMEQGVLVEPAYSVRTSSVILSLTEKGLGIGILPSYLAKDSLRQGKLKAITLAHPLPSRKIMVAHRPDIISQSVCKLYIDLLLEQGLLLQCKSR